MFGVSKEHMPVWPMALYRLLLDVRFGSFQQIAFFFAFSGLP